MAANNTYRHHDAVIQLFTRTPVPGKCKTRLATGTSDLFAAQVQAMLLEKLINQITHEKICPLQLWFQGSNTYFSRYTQHNCIEQRGSDLGERMNYAINYGLAKYNKVILIGSDCISHTSQLFETAIEHLDEVDVVIAPSHDGGYTLIGSKQANLPVFTLSQWGTETVFNETLAQLTRQQIRCKELSPQYDVDEYTDLEYVYM